MAKEALDQLAAKILKEVENTAEYRAVQDRTAHKYTLTGEGLYEEVSYQLSKVKQYRNKRTSPTLTDFDNNLKTICIEYAPKVIDHLATYTGSKAVVRKVDSSSIIFYPISETSTDNIFNVIRAKKAPKVLELRDAIVSKLFSGFSSSSRYKNYMKNTDDSTYASEMRRPSSTYSRRVQALNKALYGSVNQDKTTGVLARYSDTKQNRDLDRVGQVIVNAGFLDTGHGKMDAVSIKRQAIALDAVLNDTGFWETHFSFNEIALDIAKRTIGSKIQKLKSGMTKIESSFTLTLTSASEESAIRNRSDATREKKALEQLGDKIVAKLGKKDWANQEGSNSYTKDLSILIANDIIDLRSKYKSLKTKGKTQKISPTSSNGTASNSSRGKSKIQKHSKKRRSIDTSPFEPGPVTRSPNSLNQPRQQNWSQLLPIINAKLPPRVIANMRYPGLVNKTGKFATSAEVVSVETTREGFPSFVFNYERDPYDVFDRTKGRPPWNTPERDPRTLVDKSVREVLKEMAIGRFYTRRV